MQPEGYRTNPTSMKQQQMSPAVAEVARWPTAAECWKVPWQFLDELRSCHNQLEATDPRSAVTSFAQGQAVLESLLLHIGFLSYSLGGAELHLMPSAWGFSCRLPGCSSSSCAFFGVRHLQEASQPASNGFSHRLWSLNRTGNVLWPYMKRQHGWEAHYPAQLAVHTLQPAETPGR